MVSCRGRERSCKERRGGEGRELVCVCVCVCVGWATNTNLLEWER